MLNTLRSYLTTQFMGCFIEHKHIVSSTQTVAHEWAMRGAPEGAVVIAEGQEEGRGRSGKSWCSPTGMGIWMSLILRPQMAVNKAAPFTLLTSLAVQKGIQSLVDIPIQIKWPNDLLIYGKKVCGILTEVRSKGPDVRYIVIGIGINVNNSSEVFSHDLQETATSLALETGNEISRSQLTASILYEMESYYLAFLQHGFESIKEEWEARSGIIGSRIRACVADREVIGEVLQLTESGVRPVQ